MYRPVSMLLLERGCGGRDPSWDMMGLGIPREQRSTREKEHGSPPPWGSRRAADDSRTPHQHSGHCSRGPRGDPKEWSSTHPAQPHPVSQFQLLVLWISVTASEPILHVMQDPKSGMGCRVLQRRKEVTRSRCQEARWISHLLSECAVQRPVVRAGGI